MVARQSANEIARYLLWRVGHERPDNPDYLTPLRLQILLYFVQGWHLAELDLPAFEDAIEAWQEGPVAPSVRDRFPGSRPITEFPGDAPLLSPASRAVVESVWNRYKVFSVYALAAMAAREGPWKRARHGEDQRPAGPPIPTEDIRREFRSKLERSLGRLEAAGAPIRSAARENTRRTAPWLSQPPAPGAP